jgi:rhamnulokinase
MQRVFGAIDLGASGGRVAAGTVADGNCSLEVLHRFANGPVLRSGRLCWNLDAIFSEILVGLHILGREFPQVESVGVDGWGVDIALLDEGFSLVANPVSYRDDRSASFVRHVHSVISPSELFGLNGLQFLPFTTLYQLAAARHDPFWNRVAHVMLLPDLIAYWLTGQVGTEVTNASTTGLLDARTGGWSEPIFDALELDPELFPPLRSPGQLLGPITPLVAELTGLLNSVSVTTIASHDTGSAVVAVPSNTPEFVFVSSGTWSLVGTELLRPELATEVRKANFTNERGIDDTTRLLRNVGGLWLLQECLRFWTSDGRSVTLQVLLDQAARLPPGPQIDVDDPALIAPGDMPARICAAARDRNQAPPRTEAAIVRCIVDSLATTYAQTVETTLAITGRSVEVLHVLGGGSRNSLLCQLTADASGLPVLAGPAEATALGNVLVQARSLGAVPDDLGMLRQQLAEHEDLVLYRPQKLRTRSGWT